MNTLIWVTIAFLAFFAFYSLYNPLLKRLLIDEIIAGFGTVGMIFLAIIWSYVAFGDTECSEGWKYLLIIFGAFLMFFCLLAAMMLIIAVWGVVISFVFPKHAEKLFNRN